MKRGHVGPSINNNDEDDIEDARGDLLGSQSELDLVSFAHGTNEKLVEVLSTTKALPETMQRIIISPEEPIVDEVAEACVMVSSVSRLRKKWLYVDKRAKGDVPK